MNNDELFDNVLLAKTLKNLANSPINADNLVIKRIELVTGENINSIISNLETSQVLIKEYRKDSFSLDYLKRELEDAKIQLQVYEDREIKKASKLVFTKVIANGLLVCSLAGWATLYLKPEKILFAIPLGFILGASGQYLKEVEGNH